MPTISSMILPQTNNPDEFEEMVKSYCSSNYRKVFSKVGRKGQKQYGLDLISDYNGNFSIAQCKNYIGGIKKEDIDRILEKINSESYELIGQCKITTVIIATGSRTDVEIQKYIIAINNNKPGYQVDIIFWDDISSFIKSSPNELKKFYPQYVNTTSSRYEIITDEQTMRLKFNDILFKKQFLNILKEDIFCGINVQYLSLGDEIEQEVQKLLDQSQILSGTQTYELINKLFQIFDSWRCFQGTISQILPNGNFAKYFRNVNDIERQEDNKKESQYKSKLRELLEKINTL